MNLLYRASCSLLTAVVRCGINFSWPESLVHGSDLANGTDPADCSWPCYALNLLGFMRLGLIFWGLYCMAMTEIQLSTAHLNQLRQLGKKNYCFHCLYYKRLFHEILVEMILLDSNSTAQAKYTVSSHKNVENYN